MGHSGSQAHRYGPGRANEFPQPNSRILFRSEEEPFAGRQRLVLVARIGSVRARGPDVGPDA